MIIVGVLLCLVGVAVAAIIDAALIPADEWWAAGRSKAATILLLLLTGSVGGICYWTVLRRGLRTASPVVAGPPRPAQLSTESSGGVDSTKGERGHSPAGLCRPV